MAIERVCVIGAGVIGSLYAGHLASVAEVSVLTGVTSTPAPSPAGSASPGSPT